jgi:ribose transport system permease protein
MNTTALNPPAQPSAEQNDRSRSRRQAHDLLGRTALLGIWLLMVVVYAILSPDVFWQSGTFTTIFGSQQPLVFLGMALVCTFVVGEFDLSVASTMGLTATVVPVLVVNHDVATPMAVAVALAAALVVGLVNGYLVVRLGVDPIVITLGMGTLLLGVALKIADMNTVSGLSVEFARLSNASVLGLPVSFYYGLVLTAVIAYVLGRTPLGRNLRFVGTSPEVARLAGVKVVRLRMGAYLASAFISGLGGVLLVAGLGGFDPSSSPTYLLPALSAVFLGTAAIMPGRFNAIGTFVAVYFLVTGILGLQILGLTGWISQAFYGGALVLAVTMSTLIRNRTAAR